MQKNQKNTTFPKKNPPEKTPKENKTKHIKKNIYPSIF